MKNITPELLSSTPWIQVFAPQTLDEMVLPQRILAKFVDSGGSIYGNLFFGGNPGCGKSALAKILCKNYNTLYRNASVNGSIDALRTDLLEFATSTQVSLDEEPGETRGKVIFLDEVDYASAAFFAGLRGFMDQFPDIRFICTANYVNKIPPAIQSRFDVIDFALKEDEVKPLRKAAAMRMLRIAKAAGIEIPADKSIRNKALTYCLDNFFPDYRSIFQAMQNLYMMKQPFKVEHLDSVSSGVAELFKLIFDPTTTSRIIHAAVMSNHMLDPAGSGADLSRGLWDYMEDNHNQKIERYGMMTVVICDYIPKFATVPDQVICLKAMLYALHSAAVK
jgi:replication-associated recombination protein RarA